MCDNICLLQRGQIFYVSEILGQLQPVLYRLKDLQHDEVKGLFYAQQLTPTEKPKDTDYFFVETVLKEKTVKKKKYYYCKFLFYPGKIEAKHFESYEISLE